ncbi:glycosyltransferase family 4 protein [Stigmatella aurantiaca]|nr:glycosyltransferase family 4 protein [Stigmatella aurantiaca]EAU67992.1 putative colanic acid biosynthesis glycosyl transferase WcaL [Stigmatella aurantiaca DW4/3-1]
MSRSVSGRSRRVAYLMSWFPAVTETFILYEILELERLGVQVEVFPLFGRHGTVRHPGASKLIARAHYRRMVSWAMVSAQLYWLWHSPLRYLAAWWMALSGNRHSWGFFVRAFAVIPKAALFAREMQRLQIEHVHAHWATHPTLAALVIQRLTGLSFSFTCHAHDLFVDRTMLDQKLAAASFAVTISEFNRNMLVELYGEEAARKVIVVRCGVDQDIFRPRPRPRGAHVPVILCVASLRDYKGHSYLIEACRQLKEAGTRFRCQLVGDGPLRRQLEAEVEKAGVQAEIEFLGSRRRNEVAALLARADVVVQPSVVAASGQMEGIPVSLMEALASEAPVVATRISAIPELILDEETGLLVPEKDARALAGALLRLLGDRHMAQRLGRNGRRRVLQHFNLRGNVVRLAESLAAGAALPPLTPQAEGIPEQLRGREGRTSRRSRQRVRVKKSA